MIYAFFWRWSSRHGSVVLTLSLELRAWPVTQADLSLCLSNTPCTHLNHTGTATASHRPCLFCFFSLSPALYFFYPSPLSQQLHVYSLVSVAWRHNSLFIHATVRKTVSRCEKMCLVSGFLLWIKDRGSLVVKGKVSDAQAPFSHQPLIRKQSDVMWSS